MLYGTTYMGGVSNSGTVYMITTNGQLTNLASFYGTNGAFPRAGLVLAGDGNFYGTTEQGGTNGGYGTVFRMSPAGAITSIYSFDNVTGANPYGGLCVGTNGVLYGTTQQGGPLGNGFVFSITTNELFTNLVTFNGTNGANPYATLLRAADGNFYGSTYNGGDSNVGMTFKMTHAGGLTPLASFNYTNGANPYGDLAQGTDGNFYGTTFLGGSASQGTVFSMSPGGAITTLGTFDYFTNGANPTAGLARDTNGIFYGVAHNGGARTFGTIFRLVPLLPSILTASHSGGAFTFSWSTVPGATYRALFKNGLAPGGWTTLVGPIVATNSTASATDLSGSTQRFYQVQMTVP
jgi:uncharacterized repeat protein (TIGR03803 family)